MPNASLGPRLARAVRLFVLAPALLSACSDNGGGTGPSPALALDRASGPPMTIVTGSFTGGTLPQGPLTAAIGDATVKVARIADTELAFAIPNIPAGQHPFEIEIGGTAFTATVEVTAGVTVADPMAYLTTVLDAGEAEFDALEAELDAMADDALVDTAQRRQDLARIRALLADARQHLTTATPDELASAAAFLAVNADAFGGSTLRSSGRDGLSLQSATGACLSQSGTQLHTYEECSQQLTAFGNDAVARLVVLAGITAAAYVEGATVIGIVGAVATAIVIYKELARIQDGTFKRFIDPVMAKLSPPFGSSQHRGLSLQVAGGASQPEYFVHNTTRPLRVKGEYRSLQASDASMTGLSSLVGIARTIETIINGIRTALLMSPMRPLVPSTPHTVVTRDVPAKFLKLGGTGGGVSGTATVSDTAWMLRFTRSNLTSDVPFTFTVRYEPPNLAVQQQTVDGMLIPTARFIARSLATGRTGSSMCAFDVNGQGYCWGQNLSGKLGDLTTTDRSRPTRLETGTNLVTLTMGDAHTCGLTALGKARCWGQSYALGDPDLFYTYDARLTAGPVWGDPTFTTLSAGRASNCGLSGGKVLCWGGIVTYFDTTGLTVQRDPGKPNLLPNSPSLVSVDVGGLFACGLSAAGTAYCFGYNSQGQLGDGTRTDRGVAVPISGGRAYSAVSVGDSHACALTTQGQAYCWGFNSFGQIGDDLASASSGNSWTTTPAPVAGGLTFSAIEVGSNHSCALTPAGKAYCWGGLSQLNVGGGLPPNTPTNAPTPVNTSLTFSTLSAGNDLTCGIATSGGGVYCWGMNSFGEVGIGQMTSNEPVSAVAAPQP